MTVSNGKLFYEPLVEEGNGRTNMSRFDFKGEIFQELLAQAKKDADKGELIELEDMAGILGYTARDVARALANRYRDSGISGKDSGAILRYGVLIGWYAAMTRGPRKAAPSWWKRLGGM